MNNVKKLISETSTATVEVDMLYKLKSEVIQTAYIRATNAFSL